MDKVRLGRALGYGTRHAAKTLSAVVEAAATPDPKGKQAATGQGPSSSSATQPQPQWPSAEASRPNRQRRVGGPAAVARGARGFGRSIWEPLALFSGVLWLRVTGLFFGMVALSMASAAWRLRSAVKAAAGSPEAHRCWLFSGFALLFAYFAVSGFVRANLKERRAGAGAGDRI